MPGQVMSLGEFIHLKERRTTRVGHYFIGRSSSHEVQRLAGKVTLPNFDGGAKSLVRAWIQKLDTYFHLNPMKQMPYDFPPFTWREMPKSGGTMG